MRFKQFDILTGVDSDGPLQLHFKPRNSKWYSVGGLGLAVIEYSVRMRRLIWDFAGRTYHTVGNLMHWLMF